MGDTPTQMGHQPYRADIDGLRTIAVVAVIAYHVSTAAVPGGFRGVDIFFVISGYVVTGSLLCNPERSPGAYLLAFYSRRLKRLTPAIVFMVSITAVLMAMLVDADRRTLGSFYTSAQLGMVGWANNQFASAENSYFDQDREGLALNPFMHCWSLGVEEQFYLVFPLMMLALYSRRALQGEQGCACPSWLPMCVLLLCMGLSLLLGAFTEPFKAFFLMPTRFWQLAAGAVLNIKLEASRVTQSKNQHPVTATPPIAAAALLSLTATVLITISFVLPHPQNGSSSDILGQVIAVAAATAYIAAGSAPLAGGVAWAAGLNWLLSFSPIVYVGKISYPLYLWHWPIIVLYKWSTGMPSWLHWLGAVGFSLPMAMISYHVVEAAPRAWRPRHKWHAIVSMLALIGVVEVGVELLRRYGQALFINKPLYMQQLAIYSKLHTRLSDNLNDESWPVTQVVGFAAATRCACRYDALYPAHRPQDVSTASNVPRCLVTEQVAQASIYPPAWEIGMGELNSYRRDPQSRSQCYFTTNEAHGRDSSASEISACLAPNRSLAGSKALFLIGDSHALSLVPGLLAALHGRRQLRFVSFAGDGCGVRDPQTFVNRPRSAKCAELSGFALAALEEHAGEGDVIAITFATPMSDNASAVAQNVHFVEHVLVPIARNKSARVLVFGDVPCHACFHLDGNPLHAHALPDVGVSGCQPSTTQPHTPEACVVGSTAEQQALSQGWEALAARSEDVTYMNLYPLLLDPSSNQGHLLIPGTKILAYEDEKGHLSGTGSLYLWPHLCEFLDSRGWLELPPANSAAGDGTVSSHASRNTTSEASNVRVAASNVSATPHAQLLHAALRAGPDGSASPANPAALLPA